MSGAAAEATRDPADREASRARWARAAVLAAVLVGAALRVWIGIAQPMSDLRGDSVTFAYTATHGWSALSAYYPLLPQLYYMAVAALTGLSGGTLLLVDPHAGRVLAVAGVLPAVATIVLVERLARRLGGVRAGVVAAWLAAVSPSLIFASSRIMTESIVVAATAATLLAWYRLVDDPTWRNAAWAVAAVTALVFTRAEGLAIVLIMAMHLAWLALRSPDRTSPERTGGPVAGRGAGAALALVVLVVPSVVFAGWSVWSTRLDQGGVDEVGMTSFGLTALAGNCPSAYRQGPLIGWKSYPCIGLGDPKDPEVQRWAASRRPRPLLKEYVREAGPARVLGVSMIKVLRANGLFAPKLTVRLQAQDAAWPVGIFRWTLRWWWFLLATAAGGLVLVRRAGSSLVPLLAPVLTANAAIFLTWGNPRYRAMAEPSLLVAASCLIAATTAALSRRGAQ